MSDIEQPLEEIQPLFEMWWNGAAPLILPLRNTEHAARAGFYAGAIASVPSQVEAAVKAEREKWEALRNAGAQLSNMAYNLSQQAGRVITERDAELSRQCSDQWDAAIRSRGEASK